KGYRGHDAPNPRRVFISGQKRGVFGRIKRELTRRSAIEVGIGHMKAGGSAGRCYLKGRAGDAANVILSAVGYNLRLVLAWLRIILRVILLPLLQTFTIRPALKPASRPAVKQARRRCRVCKAWARVPAGIANARARSVAAPIANREQQKS